MKSVWNESDYRELCSRIDRLQSDARARWGKFTAPQMVCHLADALRMAHGTFPVKPRNLPLRYPGIKQLVIYQLPFPKGAPTAPELLVRQATEWHGEVDDLKREFAAF